MPSNHLIVSHHLLLPPSIFPSIRVLSNESVLWIRWPKYWSFSFSISPMNIQDWFSLELTGLISLLTKRSSRVFSNTTIQKHQFFSTQPSVWSNSHPYISSVQSLSRVRLFAAPWIAAHQASLSITNSQSLLKLMSYRVSDAIQPSHPLLSPSPPAPNPSQHQGLFQWVNSLKLRYFIYSPLRTFFKEMDLPSSLICRTALVALFDATRLAACASSIDSYF